MEVLSSRMLTYPAHLDRARSFYEQGLGLRVAREYGTEGVVQGVVYFVGGGRLELAASPAPAPPRLWLQVPDLGAEHDRLQANRVEVAAPPELKPWGLREMAVRDPDGLQIQLVEIPDDHPLRRRL